MLRACVKLGISPSEFWRMTPHETIELLYEPPRRAGVSEDELAALMEQYPDEIAAGAQGNG